MNNEEIVAQNLDVDIQVLWNAHGTYRDHCVRTYGTPPFSWEEWVGIVQRDSEVKYLSPEDFLTVENHSARPEFLGRKVEQVYPDPKPGDIERVKKFLSGGDIPTIVVGSIPGHTVMLDGSHRSFATCIKGEPIRTLVVHIKSA